MEKLLLIGINTRSMLNSALELDYDIYSTSYFSTADTPSVENQKIVLKEKYGESSGVFEDEFDSKAILEISKDYIDEADYIIPISGISPNDFKKSDRKKILGNDNVDEIENKFRFYKKIKDEFQRPMTFHVSNIDEAYEIQENHPNIKFILKPLQGSGGYDVNLLNNCENIEFGDGEYLLQEYVNGISLSSSVLSDGNDAKTVTNSRLLTVNDFENNESFIYVGNILPLTDESIIANVKDIDKINTTMKLTSEKLARKFKLVGSNGVDYILNENGLYVIEINPRIQGTFECVEKSFDINMLDAHIRACQGEIVEIPKAKYYSFKKIIYSPTRMIYPKTELDNVYDVPHVGTITEKSEPLLTIIDKNRNFDKLYEKVENTSQKVNQMAKKHQQDVI